MGKVVDINANKPHLSGEARCLSCRHEWAAVAPVGTTVLQCPECMINKGVFCNLCFPPDSLVFTCECGSDVFNVTDRGVFCIVCGSTTEYDML